MRSAKLYEIELALSDRYYLSGKAFDRRVCRSVAELRSHFPNLPIKKLDLEGLQKLIALIPKANLTEWQTPTRDLRQRPRPGFNRKKLSISDAEILELRNQGETLEAIARVAGCSRETIRKIIQAYSNGRVSLSAKLVSGTP